MKIYTRGGDFGETRLPNGLKVKKSDPRLEACGVIDELNSFLGALAASFPDEGCAHAADLQLIQADLILLSAWLVVLPESGRKLGLKPFRKEKTAFLEGAIDRLERLLPELREFIIPGGYPSAAWAHIARSVCRRAERRVVQLMEGFPATRGGQSRNNILAYLNRLSDYLYVLARWCNFRHRLSAENGDGPDF